MFFRTAKDHLLAGKKIRRKGGEIWEFNSKTHEIAINGVINKDISEMDLLKLIMDVSAMDWEVVDE